MSVPLSAPSSQSAPLPSGLPSVRLSPQRLPDTLLPRSGVMQLAQRWRDYRLTLVTAPAGYGKTTLAARAHHAALHHAALQEGGLQEGALQEGGLQEGALPAPDAIRAFWLAMTEEENEPARLVFALSATLRPLIPDVAQAAMQIAVGGNDPRRALLLLLLGIERVGDTVLVVLDDFHRVQGDAARDLMGVALEQGPENLHWMLTARHMTPLQMGRLRLLGHVLEIGVEDLRLNREEIAAYARDAGVEGVDAGTAALLEERTQGWIAGLHLAILSLQRGSGAVRDAHALLRRLQGENSVLAEYLAGEVLARLPTPLRTFLLETSILERLHPDLCAAVTGNPESDALLHEAVSLQLFLRELEGAPDWYVLHQLIRDLLQRSLKREQSSATIQALYRRAADWSLARADVTGAVQALLDGGLDRLAAEVVESRTRNALLDHRTAEVRRWILMLPEALVDERPQLLIDLTWVTWGMRPFAELPAMLQRNRRALAAHPETPRTLHDETTALELIYLFYAGDRRGIRADVMKKRGQFAQESYLARGWAQMLAVLADGPPDLEQLPGMEEMLRDFEAARYLNGEVYTLGLQAGHYALRGRTEQVVNICQRGMELTARMPWSDPTNSFFFVLTLGETLYWNDRIDEARAAFEELRRDGERLNMCYYQLWGRFWLDLCDVADGRRPGSITTAANSHREEDDCLTHVEEEVPGGKIQFVLLMVMRNIAVGDLERAWACFQQLGITPENLPDDAPVLAWLLLLTAHVACGKEPETLTERLETMMARNRSMDRMKYVAWLQILRVRQLQQMGQRSAARAALRRALHTVEALGYVRMVLDEPALIPLLRILHTDFADRLLARMEAQPIVREAVPVLTPQQNRLLALLAEEIETDEIARRLAVTPGTLRVYLSKLYALLGVRSRKQAVAAARERTILPA